LRFHDIEAVRLSDSARILRLRVHNTAPAAFTQLGPIALKRTLSWRPFGDNRAQAVKISRSGVTTKPLINLVNSRICAVSKRYRLNDGLHMAETAWQVSCGPELWIESQGHGMADWGQPEDATALGGKGRWPE
jgi:hypothetical protein